MPGVMFKVMTAETIEQRRHYDKTTRLKNHDTPGNRFCGRDCFRACCRIRGFSARYHKRVAISDDCLNRVGVERRRASAKSLNEY